MSNEELPAPALLRAAARLVEKATMQLDVTQSKCSCCEAKRFTNIEHARVFEQVDKTAEKLRGAADKLEEHGAFVPVTRS